MEAHHRKESVEYLVTQHRAREALRLFVPANAARDRWSGAGHVADTKAASRHRPRDRGPGGRFLIEATEQADGARPRTAVWPPKPARIRFDSGRPAKRHPAGGIRLHLENSKVGNVSETPARGCSPNLVYPGPSFAAGRGHSWAASSSGRAPVLQTGGTGFESLVVHPEFASGSRMASAAAPAGADQSQLPPHRGH
jgi:hypothetical protein